MKVHTIIVNYKTASMTLDAMRSAHRELSRLGDDFLISVVDNDSRDGSFETLTDAVRAQANEFGSRIEVLASPRNGGFGFGNNFAIQRTLRSSRPPQYYYLLNSDAFPEERSAQILVDFMDQHPKVGIAGSYIHGIDGRPHETAFRFPTLQGEFVERVSFGPLSRLLEDYVVAMPIPNDVVQVDWLAGASMMIRREVLESVGLFDETFFLYYEEVDLCRRALHKGWPTYYVPTSSVAHVGSASTGIQDQKRRVPKFLLDSRRYYFLKNYGRTYLWGANAAWVFGHSLRAVRKRLERKAYGDPPKLFEDFLRHTLGIRRPD